jgi:hypothetical protein
VIRVRKGQMNRNGVVCDSEVLFVMVTQGQRGYWKEFVLLAVIIFREKELDTKTKRISMN